MNKPEKRVAYEIVSSRPSKRLLIGILNYNKACDIWEKYHSKEIGFALAHIERLDAHIAKLEQKLAIGRDYLMTVREDEVTVENALEAFGFGRDGLKE